MERDFLGLHTAKDDDSTATCADSEITRGSGMQWSFLNKGSTQSQYLSFRASHEEKLPSEIMTISTLDSLDVNHKSQGRGTSDNIGAAQYPSGAYPLQQFGAHSMTRSQEMRMFPSLNQPSQLFSNSMIPPITTQNQLCSTINQQPLGEFRVMPPVSVPPTTSSLVGSTDITSSEGAKPIEAPAQLTIFYAGSVCVYDDVTPEMAKAIMLLAGHGKGSSVNHHEKVPATEVQTQFRSPDDFIGNRSHPQHFMGLHGNNVAARSLAVSPSRGNVELPAVKSLGSFESPVRQQEPPNVDCSAGTSSSTMFPAPAVALPQFRKASLARFLEKRKERAMNSSPYSISKLSSPDGNRKGTEDLNLSPYTGSS